MNRNTHPNGNNGRAVRGLLLLLAVAGAIWTGYALAIRKAPASVSADRTREVRPLKPGEIYSYVSTVHIPAFTTRIMPAMFRKEPVMQSVVAGRDVITSLDDLIGRVPLTDIEPNTELRDRHFAKKGTRPGLSAGVLPGWAAQTFDLREVAGQVNDLKANDAVALLALNEDKSATVVCQRATVLRPMIRKKAVAPAAPNKRPATPIPDEGSMVLSIPSSDALSVMQAMAHGKLTVVLLSGAPGSEKMTEFLLPANRLKDGKPSSDSRWDSRWDTEAIRGKKRAWEEVRRPEL